MKPLLANVRKLTQEPAVLCQADVVFKAGWTEQAFRDAIAIAAWAASMQRLVQGLGFMPLSREMAAKHANKRLEAGYANLNAAFCAPP